jgi:hypothetical protein
MANRILRIASHAGKARYLRTLDDAGWIVRQADIRSPYAYSPTHLVYSDPRRGMVFIVETSHKRYDVFAVPAGLTVYQTDDAATEAFMAMDKAARAMAHYR